MEGRWSFNDEEGGYWGHPGYDTKDEAMAAGKEYYLEYENNECPVFYVGRFQMVPLPIYVDVDSLFEMLNESYAQDCFEYDEFLFDDVSTSDQTWLEERLQSLMEEFYEKAGIVSPCYTVTDVEKIEVHQPTNPI